MGDRNVLDRRTDTLLHSRLVQLRRVSGIPVLLAGMTSRATDGRGLRITKLVGTIGHSPFGLQVTPGKGLGGTVVSRAVPRRVDDYATSDAITHDYDHIVVEQERLRSMFAFPVVVDGTVRGVLYGATREPMPLGDVAMRQAGAAAMAISQDLEGVLSPDAEAGSDDAALQDRRVERALQELASLTDSVCDPALRERLARIRSDLGGAEIGLDACRGAVLAPRERQALRLVELGASNSAIARELGLTVTTVKAYLGSAMRKLDVRNRTSAVHIARLRGLL